MKLKRKIMEEKHIPMRMRVNFSTREKTFLENLIMSKWTSIVDNTKTDDESNQEKKNAWKKLTEEFNAENLLIQRTPLQLRKYWFNLKARKKKMAAEAAMRRRCAHSEHDCWYSQNGNSSILAPNIVHNLDFAPIPEDDVNGLVEEYEDDVAVEINPIVEVEESKPTSTTESRNKSYYSDLTAKSVAFNEVKIQRKTIEKLDQSIRFEAELHQKEKSLRDIRLKLAIEQLKTAEQEVSLTLLKRQHQIQLHKLQIKHEKELQLLKMRKLCGFEIADGASEEEYRSENEVDAAEEASSDSVA